MSEEQATYTPDAIPAESGANRGITMAGDAVMATLSRLRDTGELDEDAQAAIWWFFGHCRDRKLGYREAGKLIDRDGTTVYRLFAGTYGAAYSNLVAEISRYRKMAEQRAKRREIGFVETATWAKINRVCSAALYDSMPAYIYGASQVGKTTCLMEHARRNNHGQTRYVRMPAAPTLGVFLRYLADACYIGVRHCNDDLRRRVIAAIDDRTLLIVDELHQALIGASDLTARKILEYIREIYDRTGCGVVMCGTRVLKDEIERGRQALVYDQFRRRGMIELVLPDRPPRADILKIAAAFGLDAPPPAIWETIGEMLQESGLGKFIRYLQLAHGTAVGRKQTVTWDHYAQAYRNIRALSHG